MLGDSIWDTKRVEKFLRDILAEPDIGDDFELQYKAGQTAFHARVYVNIFRNELIYKFIPRGTPMEPIKEAEKAEIKKLSLSESDFKNFIEGLVKFKVWELRPCSDLVPLDTAMLKFVILQKGEKIFETMSWTHCIDIKSDERLVNIMDLIRKISPDKPMPP